jgi:rhodanese-related sulfurtransferase
MPQSTVSPHLAQLRAVRLVRTRREETTVQFAQIASAFSSPKRIEIIDLLAQGERSVDAIAREAHLTVANTSRHLQVLKVARIVASRKDGVQAIYRLADPEVLSGYRGLQRLAESRSAELGRLVTEYFSTADGLEAVTKEELRRRTRAREAVVLDIRPAEEYAAGHIAGAISVPLAEVERRLLELPANTAIIAYCRGPYCVLAAQAVRLLRGFGRKAHRLSVGYPEWRDAGFPVEVGSTVRLAVPTDGEENGL